MVNSGTLPVPGRLFGHNRHNVENWGRTKGCPTVKRVKGRAICASLGLSTMGRGELYAPHDASQPWENQGYMRLIPPSTMGEPGVYAPHGASQPWENRGICASWSLSTMGGTGVYAPHGPSPPWWVVYPGVYRWCTYGGIPRGVQVVYIRWYTQGGMYPGRHDGCTIPHTREACWVYYTSLLCPGYTRVGIHLSYYASPGIPWCTPVRPRVPIIANRVSGCEEAGPWAHS